jgi:hypothetical protein
VVWLGGCLQEGTGEWVKAGIAIGLEHVHIDGDGTGIYLMKQYMGCCKH